MTDVPRAERDATNDAVMLAEYSALRVEIERRANIQWGITALQFTTAATVAGLAMATSSGFGLLLLIPLLSYMFGTRYILQDFHVKLIKQYLRESLSPRLGGALQWDGWLREKSGRKPKPDGGEDDGPWFSVTGWRATQSTRLSFEGIAALALAAALTAAVYRLVTETYPWYAIVGFGGCWLLDIAATVLMHRHFARSGGTDPAVPPP
jgi:hypothetical protein